MSKISTRFWFLGLTLAALVALVLFAACGDDDDDDDDGGATATQGSGEGIDISGVPELRSILRRLVEHDVPFALSTDGPEMLRTHLRDELALMLRNEMMTLDEIRRAVETAHRASFVAGDPPLDDRLGDEHEGSSNHAPIALEIEV